MTHQRSAARVCVSDEHSHDDLGGGPDGRQQRPHEPGVLVDGEGAVGEGDAAVQAAPPLPQPPHPPLPQLLHHSKGMQIRGDSTWDTRAEEKLQQTCRKGPEMELSRGLENLQS